MSYTPRSMNYDNAEFTVATATTDYDVNANEADFLVNFDAYEGVEIRTDQTITIKFNKTTNKAITLTSSDSPYRRPNMIVTNLYISNASGSTANIKVFGSDNV